VSTIARNGEASVELDAGTALDALKALELTRGQVVAATVNNEEWDLDRPLPDGEVIIAPIPADSEKGRAILRHSVAHLMAQAVTDLFPGAKWAIGPPVESGFYYDFDVERPFTAEDLEAIEARMAELMKERQTFVREELTADEARARFADQPYKIEVIDSIDSSEVDTTEGGDVTFTVYRNCIPEGDQPCATERWADLCKGPHIPSSDRVPAFKLLRTAGAYWRGREDRPMLQRIYGTAWESKKKLTEHLEQLEEAARRDHRRLGRELELLHFTEELGPGMAIFLPKGAIVRKQMEDWSRSEHERRGYQLVFTPHLADERMWVTSGHLENYGELMYDAMEHEHARYRLKPMNCPMHILAYQSRLRSYRELPLRIAELGTVHRFERSGVVNGLLRARGFTQDDAHIFARADQMVDEVADVLEFIGDVFDTFGFGKPSRVALSTRPEKAIGAAEDWAYAEKSLAEAIEKVGWDYEIDEGEGAFYGPKIDVHARDAIGREWQLSTCQFDFNLPERFDLTYVGEDGNKHRTYMIHRALYGSVERFFAVMLESTGGAFPTWLAPVQVAVVPVADDHADYAREVAGALAAEGVRVEIEAPTETLGNRIRKVQTSKVPYALVVGGDEAEAGTVAIRPYDGDQRKDVPLSDFVAEVVGEIAARRA
jgi:threonyl-tRNA synthetase